MKKRFRKILTTVCAGVLSLVLLSGCSWAQIDNARYYNMLVATVGDYEFTKKDLIDAFNNYGYQYYQTLGYDMETAVEQTISSMIDRTLLLEEVKAMDSMQLTDQEKLELKKQVFDYIQDSVTSYEEKVRTEWDMELKTETPEAESTLRATKTEYTPATESVWVTETDGNGNSKLVRKIKVLEEDDEEVIVDSDITLDTHFSKSRLIVTDQRVTNEAWTRYIKALQDSAKNEGRKSDESSVLRYEEDRLYKLMEDNEYLAKFKADYYTRNYYDVTSVLNTYRANYKTQMARFNAKESAYHTAMESASSTYVYYHANSGNEYVNTKHILIKFSDAQTQAITDLKAEYSIGDSYEEGSNLEYEARLQKITDATLTKSTFELDGEVQTKDASWIYNYVKTQVESQRKDNRSGEFDKLIYVFNDDDGMMNSEFDYVVNLDTNVTDKMVKNFANGVRALDTSNGGEGYTSMDMVVTEYGWHIIFHDGVAKNIVDENEIDNISDEELLDRLCNTYTTPSSNKTVFDYIYDTLNSSSSTSSSDTSYNNMTSELIADIKNRLNEEDVVIKLYVKNYKDLIG